LQALLNVKRVFFRLIYSKREGLRIDINLISDEVDKRDEEKKRSNIRMGIKRDPIVRMMFIIAIGFMAVRIPMPICIIHLPEIFNILIDGIPHYPPIL